MNICCPLLFLQCTWKSKLLPDVEFKQSKFCFRFWILSLQAEDCRSPALRYFCVSSTILTCSNYKSFKNSLCCTKHLKWRSSSSLLQFRKTNCRHLAIAMHTYQVIKSSFQLLVIYHLAKYCNLVMKRRCASYHA